MSLSRSRSQSRVPAGSGATSARHRAQMATWYVIVALTLTVLFSACTPRASTPPHQTPSVPVPANPLPSADPVQRTSAVAADASVAVQVTQAKVTKRQRKAYAAGWPATMAVAVGVPVEVSAASVPDAGITITRRYAQPLPGGASATLAFWDPSLPGWRAVASQVSDDRMSVSATVHHLSLWTDVAGALGSAAKTVGSALGDAATWAYIQVGAVFSTRADRPTCPSGAPGWVDEVATLDDRAENPIRFCFGNNDDDLIIKATMNRGFGFVAHPAKSATEIHNSTFDPEAFNDALRTAVHLDDNFGRDAEQLLGGKYMVGAGETLTVTFDETDGREAGQQVLKMDAPSGLQFLTSLLARLTGTALGDKADGWVGTGLMLAKCGTDLQDATDGPKRTRALLSCASGLDKDVARSLVNFSLARQKAKIQAGKTAKEVSGKAIGGVVGRASIYLALIGPVIDSLDYVAARNLTEAARTASLFVKQEADVTRETLSTAQVPAACTMPGQRLKNNKTTNPGKATGPTGSLSLTDPKPVFADVAGLGYKQALSYYICNAGGVSWPPVVTLTGHGGKLLGHVNLDQLTKDAYGDRGTIDGFEASGGKVAVRWTSTGGCCSALAKHKTTIVWRDSKLWVGTETITKWSADGVASDIAAAAVADDRAKLLEQSVVTDRVWNKLAAGAAGAESGFASVPFDGPTTQGDWSLYEMSFAMPGGDYVTWDVWMAPALNSYGWKLVSAEPQ